MPSQRCASGVDQADGAVGQPRRPERRHESVLGDRPRRPERVAADAEHDRVPRPQDARGVGEHVRPSLEHEADHAERGTAGLDRPSLVLDHLDHLFRPPGRSRHIRSADTMSERIRGVSSRRVVERPRSRARSTSTALAAAIGANVPSSSRATANASKKAVICSSLTPASAWKAARADPTASLTRRCSAAGTWRRSPVSWTTTRWSPARNAAARSSPTRTTRSPPYTIGWPGCRASRVSLIVGQSAVVTAVRAVRRFHHGPSLVDRQGCGRADHDGPQTVLDGDRRPASGSHGGEQVDVFEVGRTVVEPFVQHTIVTHRCLRHAARSRRGGAPPASRPR